MKTRAIIKLHYDCNNNCIFCHASTNKAVKADLELTRNKLKIARELGIEQIIFSGGEPTIYHGLEVLMQDLAFLSFSSGFISNGRMFFYKEFTEKILSYRTDYFYISLHSTIPETHDRITGIRNSWKQSFGGIKNLIELSKPGSIDLTVNCVLNHYNIDQLDRYILTLHDKGIKKIKFSIPDIKGNCLLNKNLIVTDIKLISDKINSCFELAAKNNIEASYDGLPPCLINKDFRKNINNLLTNNIYYMSEVYEDYFFPVDEGIRWKPSKCQDCAIKDTCPGFYRDYTWVQVEPFKA
jgi:MoaA/NifB/PqqE/SkfB family radical SAM enzyme